MIDELFMQFLKDKKTSLKSIFEDMDQCDKFSTGLNQFIDVIDGAHMEKEDIRKKFKTMMKVVNKQNDIIKKLLILSIVYMQGSNFDSDIGTALNKMGRGEEALKTMFANKMKG